MTSISITFSLFIGAKPNLLTAHSCHCKRRCYHQRPTPPAASSPKLSLSELHQLQFHTSKASSRAMWKRIEREGRILDLSKTRGMHTQRQERLSLSRELLSLSLSLSLFISPLTLNI
ncbi:hypothetical protein LOK49_LG01G02068 [Camellia lanceoleosa]|uniref:Uncharacterized protein n=1 Tax=Camellia lanceoleosa TaxID=1840588 RepID=A0ACC0J5F3_9ERIC|nr:hypothetical protein LOK49_LG01G02068 [Camellia lanceoleosa]